MIEAVSESIATNTDLEGLPGLIDWIDVTPDRSRWKEEQSTVESNTMTQSVQLRHSKVQASDDHGDESKEAPRDISAHQGPQHTQIQKESKEIKHEAQHARAHIPKRELQHLQMIAELKQKINEPEAQSRLDEDSQIILESRLASKQKSCKTKSCKLTSFKKISIS